MLACAERRYTGNKRLHHLSRWPAKAGPWTDTDFAHVVKAGMGEPVKQALKEAERAAKKQKLCVDVSTIGISTMLRNLVAAREQVSIWTALRLQYMGTWQSAVAT